MRSVLVVLCVGLSGCTFGLKTCETRDECNPGSSCVDGFCVAPQDGGSTGGGTTTGGGAGGGTGGGTQTGGGSGGGTGGGDARCEQTV
ncbi:MAG: hypothetical protein ACO1OB_05215, partial [Archangium sp.]